MWTPDVTRHRAAAGTTLVCCRFLHFAVQFVIYSLLAPGAVAASTPETSDTATAIEQRIQAADEVFNSGRYPEALVLIQQARQDAERLLGPTAALTLRARNDHAGTLYHSGQLAEARTEFESLLQTFQVLGQDTQGVALDALNNYANVLATQGQLRAALPHYERAVALRLQADGEDHINTISALGDLAWARGELGETHASHELAERVLALRRRVQGPDHRWTLTALNNLAYAKQALHRHAEALPLYEDALRLRRDTLGPNHPETLVSLNNVATGLANVGRLEEALALHRQAYRLQRIHLGPLQSETLDAQMGVGTTLLALGQPQAAERVLRLALAHRRQAFGDAHPRVGVSRLQLAHALAEQQRWAPALSEATQAMENLRQGLSPHHPRTLAAQILRARMLSERGQAPAAAQELQAAQAEVVGTYGASFPLAVQLALEGGRAQALAGRPEDALHWVETGLQHSELLRAATAPSDDQARQALERSWQGAHRLHARLLARQGRATEAFSALEAGKARLVLDTLAQQAQASADPEGAALVQGLRLAREKATALTALLPGAASAADREPLLALRQQALTEAQQAWQQVQRHPTLAARQSVPIAHAADVAQLPLVGPVLSYALESDGQLAAMLVRPDGQVSWQALGRTAGLTDALVAYRLWTAYLDQPQPEDDQGQPVRILHWQAQGQPHWRVVAGTAGCQVDVEAWLMQDTHDAATGQPAAAPPTPAAAGLADCPPAHARAVWGARAHAQLRAHLSRQLLAPLAPALTQTRCAAGGQARTLYIVPDGPLGQVPWDDLRLAGQPLHSTWDVVLLHSLSTHLAAARWQAQRGTAQAATGAEQGAAPRLALLAIGNPAYTAPAEGLAPATPAQRGARPAARPLRALRQAALPQAQADAAGRIQLAAADWPRLPASQTEMERAVLAFGPAQHSRLVSGEDATESAVRQMAADGTLARADHVLWAAHAFFDPRRPMLSAIVLRREGDAPDRDGYLTLSELAELPLGSRLAMLSACSTALSDVASAEPLGGFAYALALAGNRDALLTLWPVQDDMAAHFTGRFMAHLAQGQMPAQALARTKREFAQHPNRPWRNPRHWAGYVLYPGAR